MSSLQTTVYEVAGQDGLDIIDDMVRTKQGVEVDFLLSELPVGNGYDGSVERWLRAEG